MQEGLIGSELLIATQAKLNFKRGCVEFQTGEIQFENFEKIIIPARTIVNTYVHVIEGSPNIGFLPKTALQRNVIIAESLVKLTNGKALVQITNFSNENLQITRPTVEPQECDVILCKRDPENVINAKLPEFRLPSTRTPKGEENSVEHLYSADNSEVLESSGKDRPGNTNKTLAEIRPNVMSNVKKREFPNDSLDRVNYAASTEFRRTTLSNVEEPVSSGNPPDIYTRHLRLESPTALRKITRVIVPTPNSDTNDALLREFILHLDRSTNNDCNGSHQDNLLQKISTIAVICLFRDKLIHHPKPPTTCIFNIQEVERGVERRVEEIMLLIPTGDLNKEEKTSVVNNVRKHHDIFYLPGDDLTATDIIEHRIPTSDQNAVNVKQYRFPPIHKIEINKQVQELLDKGIIEPSISPYNSPVWIVPKKPGPDGQRRWRMVVDFRSLNDKTVGDAYPLPNINEILDQLGGAKYFSTFDLASGFHQIKMDKGDAHKTAFSTPHGHYQYSRMPFGLKNAPATFQRLMDRVLVGLQGSEMFIYMDDIVTYGKSLRECDIKFDKLASRLRAANLKLQPEKCNFLRKEVIYLGHQISSDGVKPDANKVSAVVNFAKPKTPKNIKQFLGLVGYYRRFIKNFSGIARPLTKLLKKDEPFLWGADQEGAFNSLKEIICKEPVLKYPDFFEDFILTTDASGVAVSGILSQGTIGKDLPIAYASRLLNKAEVNYSTIEKELLAIVYCTKYFRPYLYGRRFLLVTDHRPLVWLHSNNDPSSRLVRWRLKLAEFDYKIIYKPGRLNTNADALSRNALTTEAVCPIRPLEEDSTDEEIFSLHPPRKTRRINKEDREPTHIKTPVSEGIAGPSQVPKAARYLTEDSDDGEVVPSSPPQKIRRIDDENKKVPSGLSTSGKSVSLSQSTEDSQCLSPAENPVELEKTPSKSSENSEIFDATNIPYESDDSPMGIDVVRGPIFKTSRDPLNARRDNYVYLVTRDSQPCDDGAQCLYNTQKWPQLRPLTLGRGQVNEVRSNLYIALPVKETPNAPIDERDLEECMRSLLDILTELRITSISIAKTNQLGGIPWEFVEHQLRRFLSETPITVTVCQGLTQIPAVHERLNIIKEFHESSFGGHKGVKKTHSRIRQYYYWPNLKRQVHKYIQCCIHCQRNKLVRRKTKQPMVITDTPGTAFDKVAMDVVGPLPATQNGNIYILTIQDLLTKYSLAIPIKKADSTTIANNFVKRFICTFGTPKTILTDQGSTFTSSVLKHMTKSFRIKHWVTSAFHPQSNGSIERSHHVLKEYLKMYISQTVEWDELLELATFSYNTSVHEGTKFTPHELVFGQLARLPLSRQPTELTDSETYQGYWMNLQDKIRQLQEEARSNLVKAKQQSKHWYDRNINPCRFKEGDAVFLLRESKPKGKLYPQYTGPHRIVRLCENENAIVNINGKERITHTNRLRKTRITPE